VEGVGKVEELKGGGRGGRKGGMSMGEGLKRKVAEKPQIKIKSLK